MNKTIDSIENNEYKNRVRLAMINQIKEWGHNPIAETLPAAHWHFEKMLLKIFPDATINGCEINNETYELAKKNKPDSEKVSLYNFGINGFKDLKEENPCNFVWFDYCGNPYGGKKWGLSRIKEPANFIQKTHNLNQPSLCYVTYCMTTRNEGGINGMAEKIWGNLSLKGAIKRKLWSLIGVKEGNGIHIIFEADYLGGKMMKTPMYTIGFQIGEKTITPFKADWTNEIRSARAEVNAKKSYSGGYILPEEETKIEEIVAKVNKDWKPLREKMIDLEAQLADMYEKAKGMIVSMDDKDLIKFAHSKKLRPVAIHKLATLIPKRINSSNEYPRHLSRRNVGSTCAWL